MTAPPAAPAPSSTPTRTPTRARPETARLLRLLTPREAQALARLAAGDDTPAIAAALGVTPGTARTSLHRALRKLGIRTREQAAALLLVPLPTTAEAVAEAAPATMAAAEDRPATFAALCEVAHTRLVQQTFLVTASRHRAVHAVHLGLSAAARRWREVSTLADPEGWVRAYAFEAALAPWHRGGPRRAHRWQRPHRRIKVHPVNDEQQARTDRPTGNDRALLKALMRLPRPQRRALVLHDALGMPAAELAAEVESSSAAAEGRVLAARAALARSVPDLVGRDPLAPDFGERLGERLHRAAVHGCPSSRRPALVLLKVRGRVRSGLVTGAAALVSLAMGAAVVTTLAGHGPSDHFRPHATVQHLACSAAGTGSAGPAAPGREPGLLSPWCSR